MDDLQQSLSGLTDVFKMAAAQFTSVWLPIQLAAILVALAIAWGAGALIRRRIDITARTMGWPAVLRLLARTFYDNAGTIVFVILALTVRVAMVALTWPSRSYLVAVVASLASAWVVIAVVTTLIRNQFLYRLVAFSAWTVAALSILGLLGPIIDFLNSVGVTLGGVRVTPLLIIKTTVLLLIALWAASSISNFLELRVRNSPDLTPSVQVLVSKLIRVAFVTTAILMVISSVGIDLSALALLGGAIGVGIGFGLQKIVSNFVSGIILLADKSVKPGDVVTVGDGMGRITSMNARYTSVTLLDGREILIPNEDLVTQPVTNWSYSNENVMLKVEVGVSYLADPHRVKDLIVKAAQSVPRVLAAPGPVCHLVGFGESSLDFVLYFWIRDPMQGQSNVRSAVLLNIWDSFKAEGVEIPYPVRDVRLTSPRMESAMPAPAQKAPGLPG